jgi:hypothetical protein
MATFGATALKHLLALEIVHAGTETMRVHTFAAAGLKRTFHWRKTLKFRDESDR